MDLSVIVPAYNVEKYITRCIDSLIDKKYKGKYEIIIINDGSTDDTKIKIDALAVKYSEYIRVIDQENGGLGDARNKGIMNARGEYISFVDSDDYVSTQYFDTVFELIASGSDMAFFDYYNDFEGEIETANCISGLSEGVTTVKENPEILVRSPSSDTKLYKKSIFMDNNIFYKSRIYFEDTVPVRKALIAAKSIIVKNIPLTYYYQRNESIAHTISKKHIDDAIIVCNSVKAEIGKDYSEEAEHICNMLLMDIYKKTDRSKELRSEEDKIIDALCSLSGEHDKYITGLLGKIQFYILKKKKRLLYRIMLTIPWKILHAKQ